jgi:hypothetical protein
MLNKALFFVTGLGSKVEEKVTQQMDINMERSKTDIIGAQGLEGRLGTTRRIKLM